MSRGMSDGPKPGSSPFQEVGPVGCVLQVGRRGPRDDEAQTISMTALHRLVD